MTRAHRWLKVVGGSLLTGATLACGAGVPVQIRLDNELKMTVDVDQAVQNLQSQLLGRGVLPREIAGIPELWPNDLPDVRVTYPLSSCVPQGPGLPPKCLQVDLTPCVKMDGNKVINPDCQNEDPEAYKKFKQINQVADAIDRIELDRLIVRIERNTIDVDLPELEIQVAPDQTADPDDTRAWIPVGTLPGAPYDAVNDKPFVGDLEFKFERGGETFFNDQLEDKECGERAKACEKTPGCTSPSKWDCKEFAIRALGTLVFDTVENPRKPRGRADVRLIVVATFFLKPT